MATTLEEKWAIYDAYCEDVREHGRPSWKRISNKLPKIELAPRTMRRYARELADEYGDPTEEGFEDPASMEGGTINLLSSPQPENNIDLSTWQIQKIKEWQAQTPDGIQSLRSTEYRPSSFVFTTEDFIGAVQDIVSDFEIPEYKDSDNYGDGDCCFEIMIPDLHMGKFFWDGKEAYGIEHSKRAFTTAVNYFLRRAEQINPSEIVFVVGNDHLNFDNLEGSTTAGTPQDNAITWKYGFSSMAQMLIWAVDKAATIAPVFVPVVPGNHDRHATFAMGVVLEARYGKCDSVFIDNNPSDRKYHLYKNNLIGFSHGDQEPDKKLPMLMAHEWDGGVFSKLNKKEFHLGHLHKESEKVLNYSDTVDGVVIRRIGSVSFDDNWHHRKGYVLNGREAMAFQWTEQGLSGVFPIQFKK